MAKDILAVEVERALGTGGCPMCTFVQDSVSRYVRSLLYEYVNDSGLREDLSRSGGFCREHAWLLLKTEFAGWHDGMGTALLHEQILGDMLEELDEIVARLPANSSQGRGTFAALKRLPGLAWLPQRKKPNWAKVRTKDPCPVCRIARQSEDIFAFGLLENLANSEFRERYLASEGLCIPHLLRVVRYHGLEQDNGKELTELLDMEKLKVGTLVIELKEYVRKHEHRFAHEPKGDEQTAWIRAVRKAVGNEPEKHKEVHG